MKLHKDTLGRTFLYFSFCHTDNETLEKVMCKFTFSAKFLVSHLVSGIKELSKSQDKSSTSTLSINFTQRFEEEKLRTLTGK